MIKVDYKFKDQKLLRNALTHPSMCKSKGVTSYERLEFLGDKIIGAVIAEVLYCKFPQQREGAMSIMYSNLVNTETLAIISRNIGLDKAMIMDEGEERIKGRANKRNLENGFESFYWCLVYGCRHGLC